MGLGLKKNNKFYCAQGSKIVKAKDVVEGHNFLYFDQFLQSF